MRSSECDSSASMASLQVVEKSFRRFRGCDSCSEETVVLTESRPPSKFRGQLLEGQILSRGNRG
jgi:hypothetical protein